MSLICTEIPFRLAADFVNSKHRHHKAPTGHKFSLGAFRSVGDDFDLVAVAIVGRPSSPRLDARKAWEVTRLCSDGSKNACSFLYAACAREAKRRGSKWIITYILKKELGTSLKAAGWHRTITTPGKSWNVPSRPRVDKHPLGKKIRYEKYL